MTAYLLAGPATEPITLADAKAFLRVDGNAEDALITTLIVSARLHVEGVTGKAMIAQTWRKLVDAWPADGTVRLARGPVLSLSAITAYDAEGDAHVVPLAGFVPEQGDAPARLIMPQTLPTLPVLRDRQAIEIDYVAGFGTDADTVPADLKQAMLTLVGYWFENRDAVIVAGSGAVVPPGFDRLVAAHRSIGL